MTETKTFYALTNGFSTDRFKSEKPTEVPEDCTVEEREVVWNPELEKLTGGYAFCLYRRSQADGKARIDFQGRPDDSARKPSRGTGNPDESGDYRIDHFPRMEQLASRIPGFPAGGVGTTDGGCVLPHECEKRSSSRFAPGSALGLRLQKYTIV